MKTEKSKPLVATKACTRCDEEKELRFFYQDKTAHDGRCAMCKACQVRAKRHEGTGYAKSVIFIRNVPCESGCWNAPRCARESLTCPAFRKWMERGTPNDLSRIPDRHL